MIVLYVVNISLQYENICYTKQMYIYILSFCRFRGISRVFYHVTQILSAFFFFLNIFINNKQELLEHFSDEILQKVHSINKSGCSEQVDVLL